MSRITRREFNRAAGLAAAAGFGARGVAADSLAGPADGAAPRAPGRLSFDERSWLLDGRPVYLLSGEFHYFRVPKADWRRRMRLFREAGGNCLATYVPWLLHEPQEGRIVFGGDLLDFEGFCDAAAAEGLLVVARPGPYQYSELRYDGLPVWLCDGYPQLLAKRIDGTTFRGSSVSYLHPLFLEKAKRWFDAVLPLVAKHQASRGGPVALAQIDNEMTGVHVWFGSLDYNRDTMGFGRADGRYPRWLEARHGSLDVLNRRYAASFASFAEVKPPAPDGPATLAESRRRRDYRDFYLGTMGEYAATLAGWIRAAGIDAPICHNSAGPQMNPTLVEVVRAVPKPFVLGSDHYYTLDQSWPQNNPTPQYALGCFWSLETLRLLGFPPTVFELPGGSSSDWPPVTPRDAKAAYLLNLALGMKGSNYYIFTGGPNPPGAGTTSDLYDYGAAIGARGEVRPLYAAQQEFAAAMAAHPWLPASARETDVRVALGVEDARADGWSRGRGELLVSGTEAFDLVRRGVLNTAFCASLSPSLVDLDSDGWTAERATPVVVVAGSAMPRAAQERVKRHLEGGGGALLLPVLPTHDENLEPCTVLADFLGAPRIAAAGEAFTRATIDGVANVAKTAVFFTETLPTGAEVVGTDEITGRAIAWEKRLAGGGRVVFLGLRWQHSNNEQAAVLRALLGRLGLEPRVECSSPNVWTSLRSHEGRSVLFLMNLLSAPMEAGVRCRPSGRDWVDTGTHALAPMTVKLVPV